MSTLSNIVRENQFRPEDVPRFVDKLFYEGQRRRPYLERFFVLLLLASTIATAGLLGDSAATIIGAMIIAPLMTPIMATGAALVMGQTQRAAQSLSLVGLGIASVVGLSWLLASIYSGVISFEENSQIIARISPTIIDLIAALASGAAGAFCLSRDDIADSLPGVAISISLVPPLCVVGIALSAGEWAAALGALLLFTTNFLSILLAGGGVLALLGLTRAAMIQVRGKARRNAFALIVGATLLVASPLSATGQRITRDTLTEIRSRQVAVQWTADSGYRVRSVQTADDVVDIVVIGFGDLPEFSELVTAVQESNGRPVVVQLEVVPSQTLTSQPQAAAP
jgi:uncharacterized hydrophobic protein (TIGR00271 family)